MEIKSKELIEKDREISEKDRQIEEKDNLIEEKMKVNIYDQKTILRQLTSNSELFTTNKQSILLQSHIVGFPWGKKRSRKLKKNYRELFRK